LIARYAFGGWENRWTLLGLAQAYAHRDWAKRSGDVSPSRGRGSAAGVFAEAGPLTSAAFARVRGALRQVPTSGTASGLADRLHRVTKDTIVVLAKTGTLNENAAGGKLKSLAIAMGRPAGRGAEAALTCGLVTVTYFEFADDHRAKAQRAALPEFIATSLSVG
jgi:hypothetical protein